MFKNITSWFRAKNEDKKLENWYFVTWDNEYIYRKVSPPGHEHWNDKFRWADIVRICFEANDYLLSDNIYFFTSERDESYVIAIEARGGSELWKIVLDKGLFDPEFYLQEATSMGGIVCWPPTNS